MSEVAEWEALINEALRIQEPAADKERRLAQLRRDIIRSDTLSAVEQSELVARIQREGNGHC